MTLTLGRRSFMTAAVATGLSLPHVARAAARTVRMGHNQTETSHYGQGAAMLAAAVAADPVLSGVLTVAVKGGAALGDELGMLKDVARGTLDLMLCSGSVISNVVPEAGALSAPFLFKDVQTARAVLDGPIGAEFAALARGKELHLLAWGENGLRHVTANRPVLTPSDLRGLKIRVPQSEVMMTGMRALGASAEALNFTLVREALRTGQFEAQENPIVVIEAFKLHELQSHLSLTGHIYDPAAFFASTDLVEDLTPGQRVALAACAAKAAAVTREVAASAQRDGIMRLKAAGMTVHDSIDRVAFATAARPFVEGLAAKFGTERMGRLLSAGG